MKLKKQICFVLIATVVFSALAIMSLSSLADVFSPAMSVISESLSVNLNGIAGNDIQFSESVLCSSLSSDIIGEIKILSLPDSEIGSLLLDGKSVEKNKIIKGRELSKLIFKPKSDKSGKTSFKIEVSSFGITYPISCNLSMLEKLNFAPGASTDKDLSISTFSDIGYRGRLLGSDPENDAISFEIVSYPRKGLLSLTDANEGLYIYEPYSTSSGNDSFDFVICDCHGNLSKPYTVDIDISALPDDCLYSDTDGQSFEHAAAALCNLGIYKGQSINGVMSFMPDEMPTKADFTIMAMSAAGISPDCSKESDIPSDILSFPDEKKDMLNAAVSCGIISGISQDDDFVIKPFDTLTLTEAETILERVCLIAGNEGRTAGESSLLSVQSPTGVGDKAVSNERLTRGSAAELIFSCFLCN